MDLTSIVETVKSKVSEFNVLQDAAEKAISVREAARADIVGVLSDTIASLTELRDSIANPAPVTPPAPTPVQVPARPSANS